MIEAIEEESRRFLKEGPAASAQKILPGNEPDSKRYTNKLITNGDHQIVRQVAFLKEIDEL